MAPLSTSPDNYENPQEQINQKDIIKWWEVSNTDIYSKIDNLLQSEGREEIRETFLDFDEDDKNDFFDNLKSKSPKEQNQYFNILNKLNYEDLDEAIMNLTEIDIVLDKIYILDENNETINNKEKIVLEQIKIIDSLSETDKNIDYIIDWNIDLLNSYIKNNDWNLSNEILEKINDKLTDLNKSLNNIKEKEKAEKEKEKAEKEKEKAEKEKEKQLEWLQALADNKTEILTAIWNEPELKVITDIFNNLENWKLSQEQGKILSDFLLKKDKDWNNHNLELFFSKLSSNKRLKEVVVTALSNISTDLELRLQNPIASIDQEDNQESDKGLSKLISVKNYFPEWEDVTKNGDIVSSWDKYIDFGKKPPVSYIQAENGFRLKTKFTLPDTMDIRADLQKAKLEFEPKIESSKEKISKLKNEITGISINQEKLKTKLSIFKTLPKSNQDSLGIVELQKTIEKNDIYLESLELKLSLEKDTLITFETKLKKAENIYKKAMHEKLLSSWDAIKYRDNEVRERVKFLDSIWFTTMPESVTNVIFNFIKRHKGIINLNMGWKTINWRIDINTWMFGWDKVTWNDSVVNKEIFITLFNKMISWNPGEPIDVQAIISGKKANGFASKAELVNTFKKNWIMNDMWTFNINKIEEHLLNSENEK